MKKRFSVLETCLLMLLIAAVTYVLTMYIQQDKYNMILSDYQDSQKQLSKFLEVKNTVSANFVGEFDTQEAMDSALSGYVDGLGDQWSHYLTAEEYDSVTDQLTGTYSGIGVTANYIASDGVIKIVKVYVGSPAEKAGLLPLDRIIAVDGEPVADIGYQVAIAKIKGEAGTTVKITVERGDSDREISITRAQIDIPAVSGELLDNGVAYVKIDSFDENCATQFRSTVEQLIVDGAEGFVFDVRGNPGGSKNELVSILDMLLPEGVIFRQEDKAGNTSDSQSDASEIDMPMTVLVNYDSVSAAEYFAAVLQEYDKATVIGEHTMGKGYAQVLIPFSDGTGMLLSTTRYYTPGGRSLSEEGGIEPDINIDMSTENEVLLNNGTLEKENDIQLQKALEVMEIKLPARAETETEAETSEPAE